MCVTAPEAMTSAFVEAFNARDKTALLALYAEDAVYTFDGVSTVVGLDAVDTAFSRSFGSDLRMDGEVASLEIFENVALLRMSWRLLSPDGSDHSHGVSAEVLRRGSDGLWRYIIDDATGGWRSAMTHRHIA